MTKYRRSGGNRTSPSTRLVRRSLSDCRPAARTSGCASIHIMVELPLTGGDNCGAVRYEVTEPLLIAQRPPGAIHIVKGRTASSIGSRQTMARSGSAMTAARRSSVASPTIPTRSASGWARSTAMPASGPVSGRCRQRATWKMCPTTVYPVIYRAVTTRRRPHSPTHREIYLPTSRSGASSPCAPSRHAPRTRMRLTQRRLQQ